MFSKNIANITRWQLNICTPVQSNFLVKLFFKLRFIKISAICDRKSSPWASNEKISIGQGIRSFVPCIVKGINNHMFQSTQMGLLAGFIRLLAMCWPRPGLKAWLCFHLSRHYHNHIFTSDFLHLNISPWHATVSSVVISRKRCGPILFIFSLPHNLFIVLTGFLRIWWNHKHRTALPKQENREIKRNSSISFAAKEELLSEPAQSGRRAGNLAIIVCKCPPSFLFHIWHWMAMTAKTEWKVFWVIYYAFG